MDSLTRKSLQDLKQMYQSDDSELAQDHLLAIMQDALESISLKSISTLDEIRYKLEQAMGYEHPENQKSYLLGMVHGFTQFLNYWILLYQKEQMIAQLSPLERRILRVIADHPHITPTDLMPRVGVENKQQMSNLLRQLRSKELVNCWEGGRYRYYDITTIGQKVLESFGSQDEQSSAVDQRDTIISTEIESVAESFPSKKVAHNIWISAEYDRILKAYAEQKEAHPSGISQIWESLGNMKKYSHIKNVGDLAEDEQDLVSLGRLRVYSRNLKIGARPIEMKMVSVEPLGNQNDDPLPMQFRFLTSLEHQKATFYAHINTTGDFDEANMDETPNQWGRTYINFYDIQQPEIESGYLTESYNRYLSDQQGEELVIPLSSRQ